MDAVIVARRLLDGLRDSLLMALVVAASATITLLLGL